MSRLSIFETKWIDLVFENRNKEYGAYQLRQENPKTTMKALSITTLFLAIVIAIPKFSKGTSLPATPPLELPEVTYFKKEVVFQKPPQKQQSATVPGLKKSDPNTDRQLTNPEVTKAVNAEENIATNETIDNTITSENPNTPGDVTLDFGSGNNGSATTGSATGTETPFNGYELDVNPSFPGGIKAFLTYVGKNFKTPDVELDRTMKVFVSFVVEKDGTLTDIVVKKDPGYGLGAEAIRVLKSLKTKWEPGKKNGKAVRAYYNLPITIQMQ